MRAHGRRGNAPVLPGSNIQGITTAAAYRWIPGGDERTLEVPKSDDFSLPCFRPTRRCHWRSCASEVRLRRTRPRVES